MKLNKKELLDAETPVLNILKIILENRIEEWSSEGHNGDNYVQYKIHNGLFTYHVNKEKRPFSLSSQRYCAAQSWGPSQQLVYYDAIDIALSIIKQTANSEERDEDGNTPLMLACLIGEPRLIRSVLAETKDSSLTNKNGETALHCLARSGREDAAKLFLKKENSPNINVVDKAGWTALHHLVDSGDEVGIFKLLQKRKIDFKLASIAEKSGFSKGTLVLDIAKDKSRSLILPLLDTEKTEFTIAEIRREALYSRLSVVEKYLKNGGAPDMTDEENPESILLSVSRNDYAEEHTAEMVALLLKYGANVNAVQSSGFNALMLCINSLFNKGPRIPAFDGEYMEHVKIAKVLIDNGIDLTQAKDGSMQKALRDAAEISPEITKMILSKLVLLPHVKKELDHQDSEGFTAMHTAVRSGKLETIKGLVEAGANINIAEDYGFIPLHEAIIRGDYENAKYLIEKGADVTHAITRADGAYSSGDDAKVIASKSRNKDILNLF
ncbi:MAG: Ankyrin [Fluviicola sp.]|jgi:ankyrin repeat protein|uniref:ankyrin repeat domain-containing protein n=1 Tax=Fluviicola sp. TaxID=1917219 RepID=UPI00260C2E3D|nr:ankyrin repeat domain-containing protein [Fluviicola sp.]MDF3026456.1 Ankyrin [Fluviicola sp.]